MNSQKPDEIHHRTLPSEPFSEMRLVPKLRASGPTGFRLFHTADWCITAKANEAAPIQRTETADVFAAANVTVLMGDWTRPDPENQQDFLEKARLPRVTA